MMFSYIKRDGFLYKTNAIVKLLILICIEICIFLLPLYVSEALFIFSFIVAIISNVPVNLFLKDLKWCIYYSLFIILVDFLSFVISHSTYREFVPSYSSLLLILHLVSVVSYTSLFFRTTSNLEFLDTFEKIERCLTKGKTKYKFSLCIAIFLTFIPFLFSLWSSLSTSYKARGRKSGFLKILVLFPRFITIAIYKAFTKMLVLRSRGISF